MNQRRLTFESRVFPEPPAMRELLEHAPSVRQALFADGVPKNFIGRRYSADLNVTLLEREGSEPLLRFGSSGPSDAIGVELATGHVIEVIDTPGSHSLFVNTSIEQFTQSVKAVIDRFPYYNANASDEEIEAVADELRELIVSIDPEAAVPDRYWSTFADDAEIGDLTTEAILALDR
jgi:hypothetical protein